MKQCSVCEVMVAEPVSFGDQGGMMQPTHSCLLNLKAHLDTSRRLHREMAAEVTKLDLQIDDMRKAMRRAHERMEDLTGEKFPKTVYLDHRFGAYVAGCSLCAAGFDYGRRDAVAPFCEVPGCGKTRYHLGEHSHEITEKRNHETCACLHDKGQHVRTQDGQRNECLASDSLGRPICRCMVFMEQE